MNRLVPSCSHRWSPQTHTHTRRTAWRTATRARLSSLQQHCEGMHVRMQCGVLACVGTHRKALLKTSELGSLKPMEYCVRSSTDSKQRLIGERGWRESIFAHAQSLILTGNTWGCIRVCMMCLHVAAASRECLMIAVTSTDN